MSRESEHITGLLLAGGQGSRMGGRDKGLVEWAGRPLAAHALDRLAPQVGPLLVSANRNRTDYERLGHPVLADALEGFAGPLAGLQAGLAACATPYLACVPCDTPRFPLDLVARLQAALDSAGALVAVASIDGRSQPVFMLCRREARESLDRFLAGGGRGVAAWQATVTTVAVPFDDREAFANINSPDQLEGLPAP